jgi:hypothetical protein
MKRARLTGEQIIGVMRERAIAVELNARSVIGQSARNICSIFANLSACQRPELGNWRRRRPLVCSRKHLN